MIPTTEQIKEARAGWIRELIGKETENKELLKKVGEMTWADGSDYESYSYNIARNVKEITILKAKIQTLEWILTI